MGVDLLSIDAIKETHLNWTGSVIEMGKPLLGSYTYRFNLLSRVWGREPGDPFNLINRFFQRNAEISNS